MEPFLDHQTGFEPIFDIIAAPITDNGLEDRFGYKRII
jgi:hypothetical protein